MFLGDRAFADRRAPWTPLPDHEVAARLTLPELTPESTYSQEHNLIEIVSAESWWPNPGGIKRASARVFDLPRYVRNGMAKLYAKPGMLVEMLQMGGGRR